MFNVYILHLLYHQSTVHAIKCAKLCMFVCGIIFHFHSGFFMVLYCHSAYQMRNYDIFPDLGRNL